MIVCNRCKKEISGKFHHIIPSFINLEDDSEDNKYHLCDECNKEFQEFRRARDREFFSQSVLGKGSKSGIVKRPDTILLESRKSVGNDNCNHQWYYVSPSLYDVEACMGVICSKCGALSCACHTKVVSQSENDYGKGDEFYHKFYPNKRRIELNP